MKIAHIIIPPKNTIQEIPTIFVIGASCVFYRYIPNNTNKIDNPIPNKGFKFSILLFLSSDAFAIVYNTPQNSDQWLS